ncbi:MAG: 2Fe-2S iron-sulfur cluster-binding protein [Paracoccaceae bacterium]
MARFHELTVTDVHKTIRDAVVLTLKPSTDAGDAFDFTQGQYLTFKKDFEGEEIRRSYSICAGKDDGVLQVGIKRVEGGAFSTWANENISAGDTLQAMQPMGAFHTAIEPDALKTYLCFAGGSGITPILSILRTTLAREPGAQFTLVYANRGVNSIMFRDEIEDLKNSYLERFNVIHVLETDTQEIDLFTGRVTEEKCGDLFRRWIDVQVVDTAFICGPEPMMLGIASELRAHGLNDDQIKFELFASGQPGRLTRKAVSKSASESTSATEVSVTLDGATRKLQMDQNTSVLDAVRAQDIDAPFACKAGVCSTCRCRVLEGQVEMAANHALEDDEVAKGYVLSCQSYPISDVLVIDYDQ